MPRADIEPLRSQPRQFGSVASDTTVWRTRYQLDAATVDALRGRASRGARRGLDHVGLTAGNERVVLDPGASLSEHRACPHRQPATDTSMASTIVHTPLFARTFAVHNSCPQQ